MCTFPELSQRVAFGTDESPPDRVQVVGANDALDRLLGDLRNRRSEFRALNLGFPGDDIVGTRVPLEKFGVRRRTDPGIAIIAVPHGRDPVRLAHLLQVDLLRLGRNVVAEPSYVATVAAAVPEWRVHPPRGNPQRLAQAVQDVKQRVPGRGGQTVAIVDTGTTDRATTMYDLTTESPGPSAPTDMSGHGTAMQYLIREVNPSAQTVAIRVLERDYGEAWPTIAALIALVWGKVVAADVISLSLAFNLARGCESGLGATLAWLLSQNPPNDRWPPLVIAAGNHGPSHRLPYPARMQAPGAIVVGALGWDFNPAPYSGPAGGGPSSVWTFGGVSQDPVVETSNGPSVRELFGTSIATALVAGALSR